MNSGRLCICACARNALAPTNPTIHTYIYQIKNTDPICFLLRLEFILNEINKLLLPWCVCLYAYLLTSDINIKLV